MILLEKVKQLSIKVKRKIVSYSTAELIADTIIKATKKQDRVNAILAEKGCNYRVDQIDLDIDFPPKVQFSVNRINPEKTEGQAVIEDNQSH